MQTPPHTMSTPNQSSRKPKRPHKKSLSLPARNGVTAPDDGGERTVRNLRLSKALTIPDGTTVSDACRRMAARRIDAVLLTDSNALLSGIITDKDVAIRVVAEGMKPEETTVSKVMTRNPVFVTSDTLAIEALQKMIQGKFRHLPVVENGEVIAMLDITKCLYDAISRVEKATQQGTAVAAAVEGMELRLPGQLSDVNLESILREVWGRVAIASVSDSVYVAAKRMRELQVNSAVIVMEDKIHGILTSKDILLRVVAQNLSPEATPVEKVMSPNPEYASPETTILDALHMMHNGKYLHIPVVDKDGIVTACLDVLQITHAAISLVESSPGASNDASNTVMQKFWDSAFSLEPPEDFDTHSENSAPVTLDGADTTKSTYQSVGFGNSFAFKFEHPNGNVRRFYCGAEHVDELVSAVMQIIGDFNDGERPKILYKDDEDDDIILETDNDLAAAVSYARSAGLKALKLDLVFATSPKTTKVPSDTANIQKTSTLTLRSGIFAGVIILASVSVLVYLKRSKQ
ncbi:CBS domain-containing protein [Vigna angularis]|uniref:CBS domain-containing protein n=2 Tax=Phaseolus angularis TaxID=3914 RepID=A0A8T0KN65_PHAAN|nr:CBS domain-containing protein [Vigna angularis]